MAETGTQILSAAQREQFDRDGYFVIEDPSFFPDVLDDIIEELQDLFGGEHRTENGVVYFRNRIMDAWKLSDRVRSVAVSPKVLALLEELYGRRALPFQTLNFRTGTQQAAHSDALHFSTIPPGFMAGVWVALEDMDMDNGPLVYYPGTHKLPEVTMQDLGVDASKDEYKAYERYVADMIEREGLEARYGTIKKGQALVWSSNLLHGGSEQRDRSRSRHSQVTHYFFDGCKYYTPMLSDPEDIRWRNPVWIT